MKQSRSFSNTYISQFSTSSDVLIYRIIIDYEELTPPKLPVLNNKAFFY